jgi:hypothetical protein
VRRAPWRTSTAINTSQTTNARSRNMPGITAWEPAHAVYSLHPRCRQKLRQRRTADQPSPPIAQG